MPFMPTKHEDLEVLIPGEPEGDSYYVKQSCPHCGRLFRTRSAMSQHISKKHKEKPQ